MKCAIILAAGRGRRLGALTGNKPKCLLRVGGKTLLEHQLGALRAHSLEQAVVVTGYCAEAVAAELHGRARWLVNPRHGDTNSLYSLWLAREHTAEGFVLLNADVLFDPEVLGRVLRSPRPEALAVERRQRFDEEEMKVELEGDRIRALSKQLEAARAHAENVGVLKFSAEGARLLFKRIEELLAAGAEKEFCPYAFNALAAEHPLYAVPIDGLPWIEIDFPADLERAEQVVLPAIEARRKAPRQPLAEEIPTGNPL
ncbi:MAG: NTP transferase domain-containing protein [Terriglobia bacterium]